MEKYDPLGSNDGELCDGSQIGFESRCCENDAHYKCPNKECRDHQSGEIPKNIIYTAKNLTFFILTFFNTEIRTENNEYK